MKKKQLITRSREVNSRSLPPKADPPLAEKSGGDPALTPDTPHRWIHFVRKVPRACAWVNVVFGRGVRGFQIPRACPWFFICCSCILTFAATAFANDEVISDLDIETFQEQAEKYQERTVSNPFASGVSTAEDLTIEDLVLAGVVLNETEQYALISGYLVRTGDSIAGYRIDAIEPAKVTLRRLDVVFVLSMEGGM